MSIGIAATGANASVDNPSRMLWGGDFSGTVYKIDPESGASEELFQFEYGGDVPRTIQDLTFNPDTNRIVGVTGGSLFGDPVMFFQFNPFLDNPTPEILGTYQPANPSTTRVTGLAFDGRGNLFAAESAGLDNWLVQVDPSSLQVLVLPQLNIERD